MLQVGQVGLDDDASGHDATSSKRHEGGFLDDFWVFRKRPLTRGWGGMDNFMRDVQQNNVFAFGGGSDPEDYASHFEDNPVIYSGPHIVLRSRSPINPP